MLPPGRGKPSIYTLLLHALLPHEKHLVPTPLSKSDSLWGCRLAQVPRSHQSDPLFLSSFFPP